MSENTIRLPALTEAEQVLYDALRTKQTRKLPQDWQQGLKCPGCGSSAERPKCAWDQGGSCPRHDYQNYTDPDEPENDQVLPWIYTPHAPSQALADVIERLAILAAEIKKPKHQDQDQEVEVETKFVQIPETWVKDLRISFSQLRVQLRELAETQHPGWVPLIPFSARLIAQTTDLGWAYPIRMRRCIAPQTQTHE